MVNFEFFVSRDIIFNNNIVIQKESDKNEQADIDLENVYVNIDYAITVLCDKKNLHLNLITLMMFLKIEQQQRCINKRTALPKR